MLSRDPLDAPEPPEDQLAAQASRRNIVLWLVLLGLAFLFLPLFLLSSAVDQEISNLETDLLGLRVALTATVAPPAESLPISATLSAVEGQLLQVRAVEPTLVASAPEWPEMMAAIRQYDPSQVAISELAQSGNRLMVSGRAVNDAAVVSYARSLEASGLFVRVVVQSINLVTTPFASPTPTLPPPTPTLTPTVTPTPLPSPTATLDARDPYEPNDEEPEPIFFNQPQTHNFFPAFDVDRAVFLAKAGRTYRVLTRNLAPGVDTFLAVNVAGTVLSNDDIRPGTLASEVLLQAPPGSDVSVVVEVTNRGQYGPDQTYELLVEELLPTATPTFVPTNTPLPTSTPQPPPPTATPQPAPPTATPTPDLRDAYEPDDANPAPIGVGETQARNFYPQGEIDRVVLTVKGGHHYQLYTANLAVGVDTVLDVTQGAQRLINDDYSPPGSANYASAVCFTASADDVAVANITNSAGLYGADKTYQITAQEVPPLYLSRATLDFGSWPAGAEDPPPQVIDLTSSVPLNWTAEPDSSWIRLTQAAGVTPFSLNVSLDTTGLAPGSYQGKITFAWSSFCRQVVPVTVTVEGEDSSFESSAVSREPLSVILYPSGVESKQDYRARLTFHGSRFTAHVSRLTNYALQDQAVEFVIVIELGAP